MKLGIIIDSATGWTKKEAENKGWGFVPIFLTINGKEYKDGIDIDDKKFYSTIDINDNVSTSCASPAVMLDAYKPMSKKFDEVIFFPLSSPLSSHNNLAKKLAKDFKNIHVLTSRSIGYGIIHLLEQATLLAKQGVSIEEIIARLHAAIQKMNGMILPETMDWLKKGGRISKSTAMLGNLLSIIPVLFFDGSMEKWGKGRSLPKTMLKASKGLQEILPGESSDYYYALMYAHDRTDPKDIKMDNKLRTILKKQLNEKVILVSFPRLLVIHVGLGTYSLMAIPKYI